MPDETFELLSNGSGLISKDQLVEYLKENCRLMISIINFALLFIQILGFKDFKSTEPHYLDKVLNDNLISQDVIHLLEDCLKSNNTKNFKIESLLKHEFFRNQPLFGKLIETKIEKKVKLEDHKNKTNITEINRNSIC